MRVLASQGAAATLQGVEPAGLPLPVRPEDAASAERALLAAEQDALLREQRIVAFRSEIDALISPLFEGVPHPPIEEVGAT